LVPFFSLFPAAGLSRITRPFRLVVDLAYVSFPTRQCFALIFVFARDSFRPITFGTTHLGGVNGGGGGGGGGAAAPPTTLPHQVLQRPEPSPAPAGAPAYSWTVQIDVSSDGSTCVLL
jgi:hypothetical protein